MALVVNGSQKSTTKDTKSHEKETHHTLLETESRFVMAIKFKGVDYIEFDTLLTDDERLVRDTTRKFIEDNSFPSSKSAIAPGAFPSELVKPMGELGFFGASLKGYGCAGMSNVEYGLMMQELERGDSRRALVRQRAVGAGACIRSTPSAAKNRRDTGCPAADGRKARLLRPHRARLRLESRRHAHPRAERRRRLRAQRREDVDHLGLDRRRRHHLGEGGGRDDKSAASSSKPTARDSRADDIHGKWSLRASVTSSFRCRTCAFPPTNLLPETAASSRR